jgi:hypothetical protein
VDDHNIHIEIHSEIALDDTKPWEIGQAILLHIAEHQAMLAQQAAQMVQMQMATDPKMIAASSASQPPTDGASSAN